MHYVPGLAAAGLLLLQAGAMPASTSTAAQASPDAQLVAAFAAAMRAHAPSWPDAAIADLANCFSDHVLSALSAEEKQLWVNHGFSSEAGGRLWQSTNSAAAAKACMAAVPRKYGLRAPQ
jgi:hypothetical protein